MKRFWTIIGLAGALQFAGGAVAATLDEDIHELQTKWAHIKYQTTEGRQDEAFVRLTERAEQIEALYADRAEPKIWHAIILSTHAGTSGGFSALGKVKRARALLEDAERIDPNALDGSVYTSLGSLYYQVPGWPIGFGNDKKAEQYLKKALALNPEGIDPNYFYGDFLRDQDRYAEAVTYLNKAIGAPPRAGRPVADAGRRDEARAALATVQAKLADSR